MQQPQIQMLAYVALAMVLGGLLGPDGEGTRKPAGLRLVICEQVSFLGAGTIVRYVENRFDEEPVPALPGEERP